MCACGIVYWMYCIQMFRTGTRETCSRYFTIAYYQNKLNCCISGGHRLREFFFTIPLKQIGKSLGSVPRRPWIWPFAACAFQHDSRISVQTLHCSCGFQLGWLMSTLSYLYSWRSNYSGKAQKQKDLMNSQVFVSSCLLLLLIESPWFHQDFECSISFRKNRFTSLLTRFYLTFWNGFAFNPRC